MKNRKSKYLVLVFVIFVICYFWGYSLLNGDAYEICKNYINSNTEIEKTIGKPQNISFTFNSSIRKVGSSGKATYEIKVSGDKDKAKIYIDLERRAGVWYIVEANMFTSKNERTALIIK